MWFLLSVLTGTWWAKGSPALTWGSLRVNWTWSGSISTTDREPQGEKNPDKHKQMMLNIIKSVCVDGKQSRDLLQLCEGLFVSCCWSNILFPCGISKRSQPGLKWIRACFCWWDQIWIRNRRFSQLDPVLPAGEKQPLGLQRIQGQGPWLSE